MNVLGWYKWCKYHTPIITCYSTSRCLEIIKNKDKCLDKPSCLSQKCCETNIITVMFQR